MSFFGSIVSAFSLAAFSSMGAGMRKDLGPLRPHRKPRARVEGKRLVWPPRKRDRAAAHQRRLARKRRPVMVKSRVTGECFGVRKPSMRTQRQRALRLLARW